MPKFYYVFLIFFVSSLMAMENGFDINGNTPLTLQPDLVHFEQFEQWINVPNCINGCTPLMNAASAGNVKAIKALLDKGAHINAQARGALGTEDKGFTALMYTTIYDHLEVAQLLVKAGADLNVKEEGGRNALQLAIMYESANIAAFLTQAVKQD